MSEVIEGGRALWEKAVGFLTEPNNKTTVYVSSAIAVTTVAFLLFRRVCFSSRLFTKLTLIKFYYFL